MQKRIVSSAGLLTYELLERPVEVALVDSVLMGGKRCQFRIMVG